MQHLSTLYLLQLFDFEVFDMKFAEDIISLNQRMMQY